jgi:cytochrome c peroxidase
VAKAIANFERTVVSGTAPFDQWIEGEEQAISESAKRGFDLFNTKANCAACHSGWNFTDNGFHDIGVAGGDKGRGAFLTDIEIVQHAFKTPTLRNVTQRAPYMHDGSEKTLRDTVELYRAGGRVKRPSLAHEVKQLDLSDAEIDALCDFMATLTSVDKPVQIPILPR